MLIQHYGSQHVMVLAAFLLDNKLFIEKWPYTWTSKYRSTVSHITWPVQRSIWMRPGQLTGRHFKQRSVKLKNTSLSLLFCRLISKTIQAANEKSHDKCMLLSVWIHNRVCVLVKKERVCVLFVYEQCSAVVILHSN
jgi:acetamidase/formamidase